MKTHQFFAKNMPEALNQVQEALGPNAFIISHQEINGGVEIEACVEENTEQTVKDTDAENNNRLANMAVDIKQVRKLIEHQLAGLASNKSEELPPSKAILLKKLIDLSFTTEFSQKLIHLIDDHLTEEQAWEKIHHHLKVQILVTPFDITTAKGIIALIGPTGVGKTTTIAKLAAQYVFKNGPEKIAILSTDAFRAAAKEQVSAYANILKVANYFANTHEELDILMPRLKQFDLVLVDTAGISLHLEETQQRLTIINSIKEQTSHFLTFSANTQPNFLEQIIKSLDNINLSGCILTKIDENPLLGSTLSLLIKNHLPIAYISTGQRVPEDLEHAKKEKLLSLSLQSNQILAKKTNKNTVVCPEGILTC